MSGLSSYKGKSISAQKVSLPTLNNSSSTSVLYEAKELSNSASNELSLDLSDFLEQSTSVSEEIFIDESMDIKQVEIPVKKIEESKPWYEKVFDAVASAGATVVVGTTSLISGVAEVGEHIVDGGAYVVSGTASLLGAEEFSTDVKEFIATDWVDEANVAFYENTNIGQSINDKSAMEYDSEAAQTIKNITESATVMAASTAATVCTGGTASILLPTVTGFAYGTGNAAEDTYAANGTDTSGMQDLLIFANGGFSALSWYTTGNLGKGFVEVGKGMAEASVQEVLAEMAKGIFSKDMLNQLLSPKNVVGNAIATLKQESGDIANIATKLYNGQEVTSEEWSLLVGELVVYFGLNIAEDALSDAVMNYSSPKLDIDTTNTQIADTPDTPVTPDVEGTKPIETLDETGLGTTPTVAYASLSEADMRRKILDLQNQAKNITDEEQLRLIKKELEDLNQALVKKIHDLNNPAYEQYIQDVIAEKIGKAEWRHGGKLDAEELALVTKQSEETAANTVANIERLISDGIFKEGITAEDIVKLIQDDVDPTTYMSTKGINAWKEDFGILGKDPDDIVTVWAFQDTSHVYCVANEAGKNYGKNLGAPGANGGAFVLSDTKLTELIEKGIIEGDGKVIDIAALNRELSANYTGPMILLGVDTKVADLQLPRGNNNGAYLGEWCPGGMTGGGIYEAVIPATGDYVILRDSRN